MPQIIRGVSDTIAMLLDSFLAVLFSPEISIVLKWFVRSVLQWSSRHC